MNENDIFERLQLTNFWEGEPSGEGLNRHLYIDQLKQLLGSNLIKVLVGQRRSGKSVIMKQFIRMLIREKKVPPANILYLNMELESLHFIRDSKDLKKVVQLYLKKLNPSGTLYFLFDEIQEIQMWEKLINSYLADHSRTIEIVITGSNSKLLSTELSSILTGRYFEISVSPFLFEEYCDFLNRRPEKELFLSYLQDSGLPELFNLPLREQKRSYLSSLKDSILIKDIVQRYSIKNTSLLIALFEFLIDNMGNLFSFRSFCNKVNSIGFQATVPTLSQYIHYLENAFLIHSLARYDIKGKKRLEGERKYYLNDLGFKNYLFSKFEPGLAKNIENYVLKVLQHHGYDVHVGTLRQLEIDFVAEKNQQLLYIQVTYVISDDKVAQREYGNLEKISDNWPKIVVSMDDIHYSSRNGIIHVQAWQFESFLKTKALEQAT